MRLVPCQYCQLELVFSQSKEHEDYCGTRTETCPHCKCNVMLREQTVHPVLCGSLTPPQERNNTRLSHNATDPQPPGAWFEAHSIRNIIRAQERGPKNSNIAAAEHQAFPQAFDPEVYNSARGPQGSADWTNTAPRNTTFSQCEFITDLLINNVFCGEKSFHYVSSNNLKCNSYIPRVFLKKCLHPVGLS